MIAHEEGPCSVWGLNTDEKLWMAICYNQGHNLLLGGEQKGKRKKKGGERKVKRRKREGSGRRIKLNVDKTTTLYGVYSTCRNNCELRVIIANRNSVNNRIRY